MSRLNSSSELKFVYGYITEVSEIENQSFYVVKVRTENSLASFETSVPMIPLDQTPEELSSLYGPPSALLGRRVKVEFTGANFSSGVAKIVTGSRLRDETGFNTNKTRPFRYAVAGGGKV